jgi:putative ABC transport system permease protein
MMWINDLRYAVRALLKYRTFSAMCILTLALAMGANTAVLSISRGVLWDPLPYPNANQLTVIWETAPHLGFPVITPAMGDYADWKAQSKSFQGMAALSKRSYNLTGAGDPERLPAHQVTHDLFSVLQVTPSLGRGFTEAEDRPGGNSVVVISNGVWRERFGAAGDIVGRKIMLDGAPYTIVGVMPAGFDFPEKGTQIWTPLAPTLEGLSNRGQHVLQVIARLKPNVTLAAARADLDAIARRLQQEYPQTNANIGVQLDSLRDNLVGDTRRALLLLMAIAGCVLLIASANLANLMLARAVSRRKEMGVRIALGAGRVGLLRQLLTESAVLAAAGTALGLLISQWSFEFFSILIPENLTAVRPVLDARMLAFAFALGIVTTMLFGSVPAWQGLRCGIAEAMRHSGDRAGEMRSTNRIRSSLVVAQTAFTFVLLIAGGLMLRTFAGLRAIDPGFNGENVLTLRTALPRTRYRGVPARSAFYSSVLDRVHAMPGVVDAGYTSWIPYRNWGGSAEFVIEGRPVPAHGRENDGNIRLVTPRYIQAMGMKLLKGRLFTDADRSDSEPVTIINETMARRFWPADEPLLHRLRICGDCPWMRIVGVVADVHQKALDVEVRPEYFVPFDQLSQALSFAPPQDLAIRFSSNPIALTSVLRQAIWSIDPEQSVTDVKILDDYLNEDLAPRQFQTQLSAGFASLALLLAAVGIYGVLSYAVLQRQREIGVRMALGADPAVVRRFVTTRGMLPVLIGLLIGLAAAYGLADLISRLLYGVHPHDPVTFAAAAGILVVTGLLACWLPARRASRVDPITVLHYE